MAVDQPFWRQYTLKTFRLPPQPIRQKGWYDLYRHLSTARVYSWGSNEFGRLGHSYDLTDRNMLLTTIFTKPTEIESLSKEVVVDLACGGWNMWALTSSGKVYGWGKVTNLLMHAHYKIQGDEFEGLARGRPQLIAFVEPIERISVGRRSCLALAESGSLFTVDLDFKYTAIVKLTTPDVTSPDLPSKEHSVIHMAAGWRYSAAVIKGIGLIVWEPTVPNRRETMVQLANVTSETTFERNWKARRILRTEEVDTNNASADLDIIGLMVGDGYLIYLTEVGTVHRVNITNEILASPTQPPSFLLEKFTITPKLSYLSGSFFHFGLFNTAGDVLIGDVQTGSDTPPTIEEGLQHRGVIALSWGDWHGLALCEDGSVLSWGRELRKNGCLGMGYQSLDEAREMGLQVAANEVFGDIPRKVPGFGGEENNFAFCVAAAGWHSAALIADFKTPEVRKRDW